MLRQLVLDTETTGLDVKQGHRIIEIACVELMDRKLTGEIFHSYCNPGREIDVGATQIHGINAAFLSDKPNFQAIAQDFLRFITDCELIIHNAAFDVDFLENELTLAHQLPTQLRHYCQITDTLALARQMHPGQRNSLDALCKRYHIDSSRRELHGALLDAELLAQVYLAMTGGQASLFGDETFSAKQNEQVTTAAQTTQAALLAKPKPTPIIYADADELKAHYAYLELLRTKSDK